jgi:membrane-associated phospholipid phosphatase
MEVQACSMVDEEKTSSTEGENDKLSTRFVRYFLHYRPLFWVLILTISLLLFLLALPDEIFITLVYAFLRQRYLAISLFVFSLLALSLLWSTGQRLDAWVFLVFNLRGPRPKWLDWAMLAVTQLGSGITPVIIAFALYQGGNQRLAYILVLGTLTLWLSVELIKAIVRRTRPFIRLTQARIVGLRAVGRSFPSGHTSQSFFLASLIVQHFHVPFWIGFPMYGMALLVGVTRMYVGAHYPRDVLAGAILGSVWGYLAGLV